jgi:HPt (histidine-containing phosphotransfer) domain-containing protein
MNPPESSAGDSARLPKAAVVSAETIRDLREATGEEGYAQIRAEFLSSTELRLGAMARAAQAGDADALRRAAHALKGASGSLGAQGLEALCRELETRLVPGVPREELLSSVARLDAEFAAVRLALLERT